MSQTSPGGSANSQGTPGKDADRFGRPEKANWRQYAKFGLWIVLALIALTFVFGNSEEVAVNFLFQTATVPLYVALLIALVLGIAIGGGGVWFLGRRKAKAAKAKAKGAK
jgi:uncharacterized integral membrane protein